MRNMVKQSRRWLAASALAISLAWQASAQEAVEEDPAPLWSPPAVEQVLAALAMAQQRDAALMTLLSFSHLLEQLDQSPAPAPEELLRQLRDDRLWLGELHQLSADAASWSADRDLLNQVLQTELDQHDLSHRENAVRNQSRLMAQAGRLVLERDNQATAATLLPWVLTELESRADGLWQQLLDTVAANPELGAALAGLPESFLQDLTAAAGVASNAALEQQLQHLVADVLLASPPDPATYREFRYAVLSARGDNAMPAAEKKHWLGLAAAIDGLHRHRFLHFAGQLLVLTSLELAGRYQAEPENAAMTPLGEALFQLLPDISSAYALQFSAVDPRINSAIANIYGVLQSLSESNSEDLNSLHEKLIDAQAQISMLIPDAGYYFEQPVRRRIGEEIDICTSIAAMGQSPQNPSVSISKEQFDGCLRSFLELVQGEIRRPALSGDINGPFESDQLWREMALAPWQRINYSLGYFNQTFGDACEVPEEALVNPLEWALLVNMLAWFADQWPVYFQTPESEALLQEMSGYGETLQTRLQQLADCLAGEGDGSNDLVNRLIALYRSELDQLLLDVDGVAAVFREEQMQPNADVVLTGDALQPTRYRPENMLIGPCDARTACEMTAELNANRGLVDLFPSPYQIADQTRLGDIEICYDQVEWQDRRMQLARDNDTNVANYYGHLSFQLKGRFRSGELIEDIFTLGFKSPEEYHYLFAANLPEVLEASCPMEWVGKAIVTELTASALPIVPNRLTYLTAARVLPSRLFADNWERGAEWQDWFVSGRGVSTLQQNDGADWVDPVNRHLNRLHQDLEQTVYSALLSQPLRLDGESQISLAEQVAALSRQKAVIRAALALIYPNQLLLNDGIREALAGNTGVGGLRTLRRLRESGVALEDLPQILQQRVNALETHWQRQPELIKRMGSVSSSMALAWLQLADLQQRYFETRTQEAPVETAPAASDTLEAGVSGSQPGAESTSANSPGSGLAESPLPSAAVAPHTTPSPQTGMAPD